MAANACCFLGGPLWGGGAGCGACHAHPARAVQVARRRLGRIHSFFAGSRPPRRCHCNVLIRRSPNRNRMSSTPLSSRGPPSPPQSAFRPSRTRCNPAMSWRRRPSLASLVRDRPRYRRRRALDRRRRQVGHRQLTPSSAPAFRCVTLRDLGLRNPVALAARRRGRTVARTSRGPHPCDRSQPALAVAPSFGWSYESGANASDAASRRDLPRPKSSNPTRGRDRRGTRQIDETKGSRTILQCRSTSGGAGEPVHAGPAAERG
jgi:hypothetical protein